MIITYHVVDRKSLFVTRLLVTTSFHLLAMPPKTARKHQIESSLQKTREARRLWESGKGISQRAVAESDPWQQHYTDDLSGQLHTSDEVLDTDDESIDPTFDLDTSLRSDKDFMTEEFCDDWVLQLNHRDRVSLGLFLCFFSSARHWILEKRRLLNMQCWW